MSTRSAIAVPEGDSWKGRYCHSSGYPSWQIPALLGLHKIHGDNLTKFLTEDHCSWSGLGPDGGQCHCHTDEGAPTPEDPNYWSDESWKEWIRPTNDPAGTEWAYVLSEIGFFVFVNDFEGFSNFFADQSNWRPLGFVRWDTDKTDWTEIECGPEFEWCRHIASYHFEDVPAESARLSTAAWLGREPLDFEDAIGFDWGGTYYRRTGTGHLERWHEFGIGVVYGKKWFESVESPSGHRFDLHVWTNHKTVPRKLRKGITPVYPPTKTVVS